ncbi:MAG: hypothetical protein ABH950_10095 [Candidatus Altiarchaeota archaeon]
MRTITKRKSTIIASVNRVAPYLQAKQTNGKQLSNEDLPPIKNSRLKESIAEWNRGSEQKAFIGDSQSGSPRPTQEVVDPGMEETRGNDLHGSDLLADQIEQSAKQQMIGPGKQKKRRRPGDSLIEEILSPEEEE